MIYLRKIIFLLLLLLHAAISLSSYSQSAKSDALFAEGVALYEAGQYKKAISKFEKVRDLDVKEFPNGGERSSYGAMWLARCHYLLGDSVTAQKIDPYKYMYEPVDRRLTVESDRESDLAYPFMQEGDFENAIPHVEKCLELELKEMGDNNLFSVNSLILLGNLYRQTGMSAMSISSLDRALEMLNNMNIGQSIYTFHAYFAKVYTYLAVENFDAAKKEVEKLATLYNYSAYDKSHTYQISVIDLLYARIYTQTREFTLARQHAVRAYREALSVYSPDDEEKFSTIADIISIMEGINAYEDLHLLLKESLPLVTQNKSHRGLLLLYLAQCEDNENLYTESVDLLKDSQFVDDYWYAKCLMAKFIYSKGESREAISILEEVCNYYSSHDPDNLTYRNALYAFAEIMEQTGDYAKAQECLRLILDMLKGDKKNPEYALTFMRWVPVYAKYVRNINTSNFGENYEQGVAIGTELKEIMSNVNYNDFLNYGIGIPIIADVLLNFFQSIMSMGSTIQNIDWQEIEKIISQMVYEALIPMSGEKDHHVVKAKSLIAHLNYISGRNQEAIGLMNEIVNTCREMGMPYDNYLHDLAYYQYDSGDTSGAFENFQIGYNFNKERILSGYRWMNKAEREKVTEAYRGNLDNMPHYAAATSTDTRYAELGYNALLLTKGLLLNSTIEFSRLLNERGDRKALDKLDQWRQANLNQQIATDGNDMTKAAQFKAKADKIEMELIEIARQYGDYTDALSVDYKDVQRGMKDKDVALEFFSYQLNAASRMICALVLHKDGVPKCKDVVKSSDLDKYMDNAYGSEEMFNAIFGNFLSEMPLREEGNVYFAADGVLHTIAMENLPGSEKYGLKRLSSTRELALQEDNRSANLLADNITMYGGIYYGLGDLESLYRDSDNGQRWADDFLAPLPGTQAEVDGISKLMSGKMKVNKLTGRNATEESLKGMSGKCNGILHIATHGFFNHPENHDASTLEEDVMRLSGLYFAGAQNTLDGTPRKGAKEDGVLYSGEIAILDLRGVKLAVLSACETGKGVTGPEGVFGLQRGFKQAGTKTIMMSLWKVNDAATQYLMQDFYKNISYNMDAYEALQEAQKSTRQIYPNPKDWAAFVLIDAL